MISPEAAAAQWEQEGYAAFPGWIDAAAARAFLNRITAERAFGPSLFLSEAAFNAGGRTHLHTNPRPGRNILERHEDALGFVYHNPRLNALLEMLLGRGFRWYLKKMVCRLPAPLIPDWVRAGVGAHATNTLGAFMPPEYRDISYYYDNDLHQDIIDYPRMPVQDHRHVVLFVDLLEDAAHYVPPSLLPRTHLLGASGFPHDVRPVPGSAEWLYTDDRGRQMRAPMLEVKGGMGHAALWHNCLLHGARPLKSAPGAGAHLSLRFVLARGEDAAPCALDAVNARIDGPLFIGRDDNPGPKANAQGFVQMPRTPFLQWAT